MERKKANYLFVSVSHTSNEKNIAKSMTILKLCKRSFIWDLARCPISIRLEMALEWRPVVKNLEIQYYLIFMGYLCCNIEIKQIELEICSWCHYKENSKLYNLLIAAGYPIFLTIVSSWVRRLTIVGFLDSFIMGKWVFPS